MNDYPVKIRLFRYGKLLGLRDTRKNRDILLKSDCFGMENDYKVKDIHIIKHVKIRLFRYGKPLHRAIPKRSDFKVKIRLFRYGKPKEYKISAFEAYS